MMKLHTLRSKHSVQDLKQSFVPDETEDPLWAEALQMQYALISYLEENVPGTDKFIVRQLTNVTLNDPDSATTVHISAWNGVYEISFYRNDQDTPFQIGKADTLSAVAALLQQVWDAST